MLMLFRRTGKVGLGQSETPRSLARAAGWCSKPEKPRTRAFAAQQGGFWCNPGAFPAQSWRVPSAFLAHSRASFFAPATRPCRHNALLGKQVTNEPQGMRENSRGQDMFRSGTACGSANGEHNKGNGGAADGKCKNCAPRIMHAIYMHFVRIETRQTSRNGGRFHPMHEVWLNDASAI